MPFYQDDQNIVSNIDQPGGNLSCFWYSVRCANQISRIVLPKLDAAAPAQMGGNGCSIWQLMEGKGLNFTASSYSVKKILAGITAAINAGLPTIMLASWAQGTRGGNHCVYICGVDGGVITARDQQNGHRIITINTANSNQASVAWTGDTRTNGRVYTLTGFSAGGASLEALRPVDTAVRT